MLEFTDLESIKGVVFPLFQFMFGITLYAVFIFKFYKFLARKDILALDLSKYNTANHAGLKKFIKMVLYPIEYAIIFPIFTFFWFFVLTVLLAFLSKNGSIENILLLSMALIGSVRVTSYYNEDLSKDLAKMLPFALLGVFIVDSSFFSFSTSLDLIKQVPSYFELLVVYLLLIMFMEFALRIISSISLHFFGIKQ